MSSRRTVLVIIIICLGFSLSVLAQDNLQFGLLPIMNLNKKLENDLRINFKLESRQIIYRDNDLRWNHGLIDMSGIVAKKVGLNNSIAAGYLIRVRNGHTAHRLIQQYAINRRYSGFRLSHRLASDQTFQKSIDTEYRFRYRLTFLKSLNGESIDRNEFYIKLSNEYLNSFEGSDYDLEIRLGAYLGYLFSDNNKIEVGVDNRFGSFLDSKSDIKSWFNLSWFVSL